MEWRRYNLAITGGNAVVTDLVNHTTSTTALAAALTQSITLFNLQPGERINAVKQKHSTAFAGPAVTALASQIGIAGSLNRYCPLFNVLQAVADGGVARILQLGPVLKTINVALVAAAGACTATGAAVGDRVLSCTSYANAAGWTEALSTVAGSLNLVPGVDIEAIVTVANQVQQIRAADLTAYTSKMILETGGGLESDATATAILASFIAVGANMNVLTAGNLDVWVQIDRMPQAALGIG